MRRTAAKNGEALRELLAGDAVEPQLFANVSLQDLNSDPGMLWPLLSASGDLTPERLSWSEDGVGAWLRIPNLEGWAACTQTILPLAGPTARAGGPLTEVSRARLAGDTEALQTERTEVMVRALRYHDLAPGSLAGPAARPSGRASRGPSPSSAPNATRRPSAGPAPLGGRVRMCELAR